MLKQFSDKIIFDLGLVNKINLIMHFKWNLDSLNRVHLKNNFYYIHQHHKQWTNHLSLRNQHNKFPSKCHTSKPLAYDHHSCQKS